MTTLNPYISFHQNAREAMTFYHSVLGGDLQITTFESFEMGVPSEERHLVMHARLDTSDGLTLMGADTPSHMPYAPAAGISISLSGDDEERLDNVWKALEPSGMVTMPFEPAPWGGRFGMLTDRFGIAWMLNLNAPA